VLVTTDIAARGLDNLDVSHVVQFDFPRSGAEYLHRCGRTARAGRRGTSHSLVTKFDTELVRALRAAHAKGEDMLEATAGAVAATAASAATLRIRSTKKAFFPTPTGLAPIGGEEKVGMVRGDGKGFSGASASHGGASGQRGASSGREAFAGGRKGASDGRRSFSAGRGVSGERGGSGERSAFGARGATGGREASSGGRGAGRGARGRGGRPGAAGGGRERRA
jgi:superfamily II DNA/RNA helicase